MFIFFLKKKKVLLLVSLTELVKCRLSLRLFLLFQMPVLTEHRLPRCLNWYRFFRFFFFLTLMKQGSLMFPCYTHCRFHHHPIFVIIVLPLFSPRILTAFARLYNHIGKLFDLGCFANVVKNGERF